MNDFNQFTERTQSESHNHYSARKPSRKKKSHTKRFIAISLISAVIVIVFVIIGLKIYNASALKQVEGTWVYDEYTQYEFDGKGNGCMCLEEYHYEYSIKNDQLLLDFKDSSVHDCAYTFSVKDNTLTFVGGEGTTGGTYKLSLTE